LQQKLILTELVFISHYYRIALATEFLNYRLSNLTDGFSFDNWTSLINRIVHANGIGYLLLQCIQLVSQATFKQRNVLFSEKGLENKLLLLVLLTHADNYL